MANTHQFVEPVAEMPFYLYGGQLLTPYEEAGVQETAEIYLGIRPRDNVRPVVSPENSRR